MALSQRNQRKHVEAATRMLPADGFRVLDYALGGAGPLPPNVLRAVLLVGWLAMTVVVSLAVGSFLLVGILPMLALWFALNRPRSVLLSDRGLALFTCGFFNGRPTSLLALGALTSLDRRTATNGANTRLAIGDDEVWLSNKDLARILGAAPRPTPPA